MERTDGLASFDRESVERFTHFWEKVFDQGDSRTMAAFYAEDARLIASHSATVEGRGAIERFWRATCDGARTMSVKRTVHAEHVESADALGYVRGTVVVRAGDAAAQAVRYVTLWRREVDGVWRCIVDISTAAPRAD